MIIKARKSKENEWGFLESYRSYDYDGKGYVEALTAVTMNGELAPVYAFRGERFVPLEVIEEEVGIARYIKAKKPFYSKIREGFVVVLNAKVDFNNKVYLPDESTYEVYTLNGSPEDVSKGLPFKKVLDVPKEFIDIVQEPLRLLGESFGDREVFLRSRLHG